jgi:uncharacterized membrane protein
MKQPPQPVISPSPRSDGSKDGNTSTHSTNVINGLIHLYRAEVGRLTAYRVRLDTTTNWTITASVAVTTFSFTNENVPHLALIFLMSFIFFFLQLEARRFRAYETSRYRVLLLEGYFYPELLGRKQDPDWTDQVIDALRSPDLTVNYWGALGWRLRRNYLWINMTILMMWLGKLYVSGGPSTDVSTLVTRASIGLIPGWFVFLGVCMWYTFLFAIALGARRIYPQGERESLYMDTRMQEVPE